LTNSSSRVAQLFLDGVDGFHHTLARRHVVAAGVDREARDLLPHAAGQRVQQLQRLDLVVEQLDAQRQLAVFGRKHVDGVAAHAEAAAAEVDLVALVLHADQLGDHVALAHLVAHAQRHHHLVIVARVADAVDGADAGHDDHVAPLQQALGGRQAHLLDVLVDRAVLLDEQVALRHVGLGLVVVVVADEVLHRVRGKNSRNSLYSCAASVLLGAKTMAGRPVRAITLAIVKVLPEPVTPSSVW
jgi:hypothetical protein